MLDDDTACRWRLLCYRREAEQAQRDAQQADHEQLRDLAPRIAERLGRCKFREAPNEPVCGLEVVQLKSGALMHIVPTSLDDRQERAAAANRHRPKVRIAV